MAKKQTSIAEEARVLLVDLAKGVHKMLETALKMGSNSSALKEPALSRVVMTDDIIKTRLISTVAAYAARLALTVSAVSLIETAPRVHVLRGSASIQTAQITR